MAYVYIVGLKDGTHYCGIAREIVKRLIDHGKGRSKSTRNKRPIIIKFITRKESMTEARQLEVKIKKQGVTRWYVRNQHRTDNIISEVSQECASVHSLLFSFV